MTFALYLANIVPNARKQRLKLSILILITGNHSIYMYIPELHLQWSLLLEFETQIIYW